MSILTGLVIVVAMATLAQRSDDVLDFFLKDRAAMIAPRDDAIRLAPGVSAVIDVLANDSEVEPEDSGRLRIVVAPPCGAAEVTAQGVLYVANDLCEGEQVFSYCVARGDVCPTARITVTLDPAAPTAPAPPDTALIAVVDQGSVLPEKAGDEGAPPLAPPPAPPHAAETEDRTEQAATAADPRFVARAAPPPPASSPAPAAGPGEAAFVPDLPPDAVAGASIEATAPLAAASPPAVLAAPDPERPSCAPPSIATRPAPGGASLITVAAPCAAGGLAILSHAGLDFPLPLDAAGAGAIELPLIDAEAGATLHLPGGESLALAPDFDPETLARLIRVAVTWSAPVRLELHAFEYAAAPGDPGHVREGEPGAGEVRAFAPPAGAAEGPRVEIYTVRLGAGGRRGVARLALDHAERGALAEGDFCGDGRFASPEYLVLRAESGRVRGKARKRVAAAPCGRPVTPEARFAGGAVAELRIE